MNHAAQFGRVILVALLAVGLSLGAAHNAQAQIVVGGGLAFIDEDPLDLGLQGNVYVGLPAIPGLRVGGDIVYFFPQDDFSIISFNANAQYHFPLQPGTSVYGLAGINFSRWSFDFDGNGLPGIDTSGTETGLNLGGGIEFGVGFGALFAEAKIVTGDLDRFELAGGVRIPIN